MQVRVNGWCDARSGSARAWLIAATCLLLVSSAGCARKRKLLEPGDTLPDGVAGTACKLDADCRGGRCVGVLHIQAANDGVDAPGGYCTLACEADSQCGASGKCSVPAGEVEGECLAGCNSELPCRSGYLCVGASTPYRLNGTCQPEPETGHLEDGLAGQPCEQNADCGEGECAAATPLGTSLPGGYCSARCLEDSDCGEGGGCLVYAGSNSAGHCYARCSSDTECERDGYRCREIGPSFRACYPAPKALPDHTSGNACSDDADCGGADNSCAFVLPYGNRLTEEVEAPGGYCTQACSLDAECGAHAQCIAAGSRGGMCLGRCDVDADCREGYRCISHGRDLVDEDRVCFPVL
jgi:hypothetical protein